MGEWRKHSNETNIQIRNGRWADQQSVDVNVQVPDHTKPVES